MVCSEGENWVHGFVFPSVTCILFKDLKFFFKMAVFTFENGVDVLGISICLFPTYEGRCLLYC